MAMITGFPIITRTYIKVKKILRVKQKVCYWFSLIDRFLSGKRLIFE